MSTLFFQKNKKNFAPYIDPHRRFFHSHRRGRKLTAYPIRGPCKGRIFFGSSCRPLPFNPLVLLHLTPLQACMGFFASGRCWSTFLFRTTGLRAVEDFVVGVLRTLMGHTLTSSVSWALLPIPHFCLDYSTPFGDCQAFF